MPQERIRDYEIVEGPFNGTYGSVKVGSHSVLGTRRAIKQLHAHVKPDMIREEALKQANVKSPYVVQIYDFFEGENAIVMEYCPVGLDRYLCNRLRQVNGKLPYEEAREVLYGILQGLNDAHAAGVIHGDIKPANVRFGAGETKDDLGLPKLSDFGAARRVREDVPGIRGSTNWMAPEVIEGGTPTEASDYFSFGILAYLMLSGQHPFFANDPSCLISEEDNITDGTFRPLSLGSSLHGKFWKVENLPRLHLKTG
jgi:serine/threonine-protein kinase